jgi:DNA repair protein RecN (Recombination protein N)
VLAFLGEVEARLATLERGEETLADAEARVASAHARVAALAAQVTRGREDAAPRLAAAVGEELRDLGMPDAAVEIAVVSLDEVGASGAERVEFRFAAGAGQTPMSLARIASGGELSRTMLACRSVLADLDDVPTLVFDEVDAGIGGVAGVAVGRRLAALAARRQVLVVTHLPQIASFADRHLRVEKTGGTATVTVLDDAGRVAELTRMLSGMPRSEAAATHAEELLAEAGKAKARG